MPSFTLDDVLGVIEASGYIPEAYSGRFMYGAYCVGIVCQNPETVMAHLIRTLYSNPDFLKTDYMNIYTQDELFNVLVNSRLDDMGMNQILYFPFIKCTSNLERVD